MAVLYMDRASIESLTEKDIRDIIEKNATDTRYKRLYDYYTGNHKILGETRSDSTLPDNRLVNNMARYITDTATGYFVGQPIIYNSQNEEFLQIIQNIFNYNDEQDHNVELEKNCSIAGSCFEMLYMDEDAKIRMARIPAGCGTMICETDSGFSMPMAFIRHIISKDKSGIMIWKAEFWNDHLVMRYKSVGGSHMNLEYVEEHYWQDVPFVEYINNEERIGDFEGVITEIDAYNRVQSNTANYFQYNDDAILKVRKLGDVSSQDIRDMKENGAILLEDGGDVDWLLKQINDTALENYKTRLKEDIHTIANVPHMCDESFGGNLSGVAISYKLWGLEQMTSIKERKFKKGLQRRIELITNMLHVMGYNFDYRDIVPKFRRNMPQNDLETAEIVTKLSNDLSRETRLQMIPFVENVQDELDKLDKEKNQEKEDFGIYENLAKAFQTVPEETEAVTDEPEGEE